MFVHRTLNLQSGQGVAYAPGEVVRVLEGPRGNHLTHAVESSCRIWTRALRSRMVSWTTPSQMVL
jgi:hypothetical protein